MTEQQTNLRAGEAVRLHGHTYRKLEQKKHDLYQFKNRRVPFPELLEWLVDNHLKDFPMDLCAKTVTR